MDWVHLQKRFYTLYFIHANVCVGIWKSRCINHQLGNTKLTKKPRQKSLYKAIDAPRRPRFQQGFEDLYLGVWNHKRGEVSQVTKHKKLVATSKRLTKKRAYIYTYIIRIYIYTYYLIWYILKSLFKRKKVFCPCLPIVAHHVQSLTILSFRTGDGWAKKEERWGRCLGSVETFVEGFSRCETIGHTFFSVGRIFQIR